MVGLDILGGVSQCRISVGTRKGSCKSEYMYLTVGSGRDDCLGDGLVSKAMLVKSEKWRRELCKCDGKEAKGDCGLFYQLTVVEVGAGTLVGRSGEAGSEWCRAVTIVMHAVSYCKGGLH